MTWQEWLQYVLGVGIGGSMIIGGVAWVTKSLFSHLLSRDLDKHKATLDREADLFRRRLDAADFEHRTSRSMLLEKRAEVIAMLHSKIVDMQTAVGLMVQPTQFGSSDPQENKTLEAGRRSRAADSYNAFADFYAKNEIFLDEELASKVSKMQVAVRASFSDFDLARGHYGNDPDTKKWVEAHERMSNQVPAIIAELKKEFRGLLGVIQATPGQEL